MFEFYVSSIADELSLIFPCAIPVINLKMTIVALDGGGVIVNKMTKDVKIYLPFSSFFWSLLHKINQIFTCKLIVIILTTW